MHSPSGQIVPVIIFIVIPLLRACNTAQSLGTFAERLAGLSEASSSQVISVASGSPPRTPAAAPGHLSSGLCALCSSCLSAETPDTCTEMAVHSVCRALAELLDLDLHGLGLGFGFGFLDSGIYDLGSLSSPKVCFILSLVNKQGLSTQKMNALS